VKWTTKPQKNGMVEFEWIEDFDALGERINGVSKQKLKLTL